MVLNTLFKAIKEWASANFAPIDEPKATEAINKAAKKMDRKNPTGSGSFSLNRESGSKIGTYSFAAGFNTTASGNASHAEGSNAKASGSISHAEGENTSAGGSSDVQPVTNDFLETGEASHAEGYGTVAYGFCSHAEGNGTSATGNNSHAEGDYTVASSGQTHAEGFRTAASGACAHAEGQDTKASGGWSHAEGCNTKATSTNDSASTTSITTKGSYTHAEGYGTVAYGRCSHAEGNGTKASGNDSHAEGGSNTASGSYAHVEGYNNSASNTSSHAEGGGTTASGMISHAEGNITTASGFSSHAEGSNGTTASGSQSHAEGYNTKASGYSSHAEGSSTKASGPQSHAEGSGTTASDDCSHAEGYSTIASSGSSHAEGFRTAASGASAHAEGESTTASGMISHAEGYNTKASGYSSHAEGYNTIASGEYSHAEGYNTTASGEHSHAEGINTTAFGYASHAEGSGTKASSDYSHVQGKYNIEDTSSVYAHIVGNGTSDSARSNAHTLDWSGNAWYSGDVYVGSTSGTNRDDGSKKLITGDEVDSNVTVTQTLTEGTEIGEVAGTKLYAPAGGGSVTVDDAMSDTSANPVQNKVISAALNEKLEPYAKTADVPKDKIFIAVYNKTTYSEIETAYSDGKAILLSVDKAYIPMSLFSGGKCYFSGVYGDEDYWTALYSYSLTEDNEWSTPLNDYLLMGKPTEDGTSGQVLGLDDDLAPVWMDAPGGSSEKKWVKDYSVDLTTATWPISISTSSTKSFRIAVHGVASEALSLTFYNRSAPGATWGQETLFSQSITTHAWGSGVQLWYDVLNGLNTGALYKTSGYTGGVTFQSVSSYGLKGIKAYIDVVTSAETFTSGTLAVYREE